MGKANKAIRRIKARLRKWLADDGVPVGFMLPAIPRGVFNGATYSQPLIIPRSVTRKGDQAVTTFMESARDTYRFQFDTPMRGDADLPIMPVTEDPLEEWSADTREDVISNCHTAYDRDPIAKAAVDYTTAFAVGDGFHITYKNEQVHDVLEAFINSEDTPVREYERQFLNDLQIDGELILRVIEEDGEVVVVPKRPWECYEIAVKDGFVKRPESYKFREKIISSPVNQRTEEKTYAADEIIHVPINNRSYEQRGKPDLYVMLPWLRAFKEWLSDGARQEYWRNAIMFQVKVDTASAATLGAVATRYAQPPTPGTIAVTSAKEDIIPITNSAASGATNETGRQLKLQAAVGKQLPEYMLSDGENANLASSTNQELPALTQFAEYQRIMIERVWRPVLKRVLQAAIDAGALKDQVPAQDSDWEPTKDGMIDTLDAFDLQYEPLTQNDPMNMAQALQIAVSNDWVSNQTASTEMGFDYTKEKKLMDAERQEQIDAMKAGLIPMPMGMGGDDEESEQQVPPPRQNGQQQERQAA